MVVETVVDADLAGFLDPLPSCSSGRLRPRGYARSLIVRELRGGTRWTVSAAPRTLFNVRSHPSPAACRAGNAARRHSAGRGLGVAGCVGSPPAPGWLYRGGGSVAPPRTAHAGHPARPGRRWVMPWRRSVTPSRRTPPGVRLRLGTTATPWQLVGITTGGPMQTPTWPPADETLGQRDRQQVGRDRAEGSVRAAHSQLSFP